MHGHHHHHQPVLCLPSVCNLDEYNISNLLSLHNILDFWCILYEIWSPIIFFLNENSDNIEPECLIDIVWIVTSISYVFLHVPWFQELASRPVWLITNTDGGPNNILSTHWQQSVSRRLVNDRKVSEGSQHNSLHLTSTRHIHALLTAWCLLGN